MTKLDWENITNYIDSVGTTDTVFPFVKVQSSVKVTASGARDNIIYTIGGQSGTLLPGQSVTVTGSISSMTLRSASGRQPFQVWAVEAGTEKDETDTSYQGQIDGLTTALAQKANQTDLSLKRDKATLLSMADMGQDVKTAMTGGSVAVVGKGAVLTENIQPKQVTPNTTNFFDIVNFMDISSISFFNGYTDSTGVIQTYTTQRSIIFKVEPNTVYKLQIKDVTNDRGYVVGSDSNNFTVGSTYPVLGSTNSSGVISFTTQATTQWVFVYFVSTGNSDITYYNSYKASFLLYKNSIPTNTFDTIKKSYLPTDVSYKADLLNHYTVYNLLNTYAYQIINASCDTNGLVINPANAKSMTINVLPSTTYFMQLPLTSDRTFVLSSSSVFNGGSTYPILSYTSLGNKQISFTTNADTQQIFVYYNSTLVNFDISQFDLSLKQADLGKGVRLQQQYSPLAPCTNKNILYLGDSITAQMNGWVSVFNTIVKPSAFVNVAVPGATWCDKVGTVYDGNPVSNGPDNNVNNVIGNQVQQVLNNNYATPDYIIIAAGTNDNTDASTIENQFTSSGAYTSLSSVDRKTFAGAMRYAVETLLNKYPNAQIFICTPIQSAEAIRAWATTNSKVTTIKAVANRLSLPIFDAFTESGIYGAYEVANAFGKYLHDGLHPVTTTETSAVAGSQTGAYKLGKYFANKFISAIGS